MPRKKEEKKGMSVKVVGCGGVGLKVLDTLCQYLNFGDFPSPQVTLIDGDTFEERNRERQSFSVIGPKATITADDYRQRYPRIMFWDHPVYLADHNVITFIREHDFVFSCVDNHKTRKLISDRAEELDNITVISGGNEYEDGNVQVHVRRQGRNLTLPVANKYHPEIEEPQDKNPADDVPKQGCDELVVTQPQLVITNNLVAATMLSAFYGIVQGKHEKRPTTFTEFYLDVPSVKVVPRERQLS